MGHLLYVRATARRACLHHASPAQGGARLACATTHRRGHRAAPEPMAPTQGHVTLGMLPPSSQQAFQTGALFSFTEKKTEAREPVITG